MNRNQKIGAGVLGALLAILVVFIVVQLVSDDDAGEDNQRAATTATTAEPTTPTATEPEPEPEPTTPTTPPPTATQETLTNDEPSVTTGTPANTTDETEAASSYARNELGIAETGEISITRSRGDDRWILATFFAGGEPVAVWMQREGEGERWVGVASTRNGQPAPDGQGIPRDLRFPFSEP